ncbi:MAG: glycosyltransferase [Clostridiales bacterium]|jgi:poly(glycerol-phosphate) alpha-glucosyltransferase|nr:glycosyltransferase [Clostridiales bacterium]
MELMDKIILKKTETVFIVENLMLKNNGILNSILRKMRFMYEELGYKTTLLVCNYAATLLQVNVILKSDNSKIKSANLSQDANIIGLFYYFQKSFKDNIEEIEYNLTLDEGETKEEISPKVYKIYKDGAHIRTEHFTGLDYRLRMIDKFSDGKHTKTIFYDDTGTLSMIRIYDKDNDKFFPEEYYYTTDKWLRFKAEYEYLEKQGDFRQNYRLINLYFYDEDGQVIETFHSIGELTAYFLNIYCSDPQKMYLLVDESGKLTDAQLRVNKANIFKTCIVHNTFLANSYDLTSAPQSYYRHLCEHRNEFDAIVFLTMTERTDFLKKYRDYDRRRVFVIPHPYAFPIERRPFEEREKKAVVIARYDPSKQLEHAIKIFKLVIKKIPEAKLEIYGFGLEEENLKKLIIELELEESVILKGTTLEPLEVFSKSLFSMMTSHVEGMPLTLLESIMNGCPAFAYNLNYGPAEIIIDNATGYLIPRNDMVAFAKKIIEYWNNETLQKKMSANCYDDEQRFSVEKFLRNWMNFMESLYELRRERIVAETQNENREAAYA